MMIFHADVLSSWCRDVQQKKSKSVAYHLPFRTYQASSPKISIIARLSGREILRKTILRASEMKD